MFSSKDSLPSVCAGCQSCYVDETKHRLSTRFNEQLATDKKYHIFKCLLENSAYKILRNENCFAIIDSVYSPFRLKLKEAFHMTWLKPNLNKQKEHESITISVLLRPQLITMFLSFLFNVNFIIRLIVIGF